MSSSTEEEIIKRRRILRTQTKKKDLKNLFDEESSTDSMEFVPEDTQHDNFFKELFGTGKEYFYIFEQHKKEEEEDLILKVDEKALIDYMKTVSDYEGIETICKLYLQGYNIYYIFLQKTSNLNFYDFLDIYKNIVNFTTKSSDVLKKDIFNIFFDRIYNGSLNLKKGDKIISLTKDKTVIKGVILDHYGNLLEKFSFLDNRILSFVEEINPKFVLISGYNNMVRTLVQLLIKFRVFYMENKFFPEFSIYDKLIHVGRLGILPEIEFINSFRNLHLENTTDYNQVTYKEDINNEEISNIIQIAVNTVISITKLEVDWLLQFDEKLKILEFLGLANCTRIFENDKYENEDEIRKVLKDEILYENFMTFFTINKKFPRPNFKGFTDNFVFRELINIKNNSIEELLNKETEGKIFFVDEFYVLVNILNNVTCYVRTTEKYYLNQIVKVRITEINEPFLSFTGEITTLTKPILKIIKHPLLSNLNSKESENKLRNSQEYFLLRQSTKDGKIIIVLKLYKDIIVHIKLEEYDNLDEVVNKKVKSILRNVSNIRKHKYFYENEDEAMSNISMYCDYIKYGFYFSEEYPGRLCFIYNSKGVSREYLSVASCIKYKGNEFETLEEFIEHRKRM